MGTIGAGAGRWGTAATTGVVATFGLWIVPAARGAPTWGWWWGDHWVSAPTTIDAPPCPRNHSAARAPKELPSAGLVTALPKEKANQITKMLKTAAIAASTRRRRRWTRALDQCLGRGCRTRDRGGSRSRSRSSLGGLSTSA